MQILQRFKFKTPSRRFVDRLTTFCLLADIHQATFAQSLGGLSRARTTLQTLKDNLDVILPIVAVIIGVIIFVLYSAEVMRKDDAIRWGNVVGNANIRNQLRSALPSSAQSLLDRSGGSNLDGDVGRITDQITAPVNFQEDRQALSKQALNIEATSKAMSERAYDSMTRRLANVDALQDKINQTTNPKEIAELQARIQIPGPKIPSLL